MCSPEKRVGCLSGVLDLKAFQGTFDIEISSVAHRRTVKIDTGGASRL